MNPIPTPASTPADLPAGAPCERILTTLKHRGDCTKGDLLDASGLPSYTELDELLRSLEGKITHHWGNFGYSVYRLAEARPTFPPWLPK